VMVASKKSEGSEPTTHAGTRRDAGGAAIRERDC
jgi:hypothetical protein